MEAIPESRVALIGSDPISVEEGFGKDVELTIILMDIFYISYSCSISEVHEVVEFLFGVF